MNFESADEFSASKKRDRTFPRSASEMVGRVTPCALPSELLMKRLAEDRPPYPPATDPPSFHYGATSAVALQFRIAHNLCVSEFQFGGDSSMLFL